MPAGPEHLRIMIERGEAGLFYATSPDLPGLLVAEPSLRSLQKAIPPAIRALQEAQRIEESGR